MKTLRLDFADHVATLTLDVPKRRNAFTLLMVDEIVATFDALEEDLNTRAVIVTGAAPAFCSGAELGHLEGAAREGLRRIYEGFLRVSRSALPTIAAVNGPAVGAGLNLALACDLRVAARSARFDSRFLDLGLHPGGGHTWMLRQLGGAELAAAMVLFGQVLDGEDAVRHGLAWTVVDDDALLATAQDIARRAAAAPRELVREAKATLRDLPSIPIHDLAIERELGPQVWSVEQPAFKQRLEALRRRIHDKDKERRDAEE